jgi:RNA polymerase sigma factor (sigma-70 family)
MKSNNRYAGVDAFALKVIRSQVRKLIQSHPCFQGYDFEDLEQELVLDFILRWPKFDPNKGSKHTHIWMLVRKKILNLITEAEALQRGGRSRPESANVPIFFGSDSEGSEELIDTISSEDGLWGDAYLGWNHLNATLRDDLNRAIAQLPPDLADICERLKTQNVSEVARETGIKRENINYAIRRLRKLFGERGLRIYLEE